MTSEQHIAIAQLRRQGYAVCVWSPEEVEAIPGHKASDVEDRAVEHIQAITDELKDPNDE